MPNITIYTTDYCPYCVRAKDLLIRKGVKNINEVDVTNSDDLRAEMMEKSGGRKTVPQIFIGEKHIGGCDDLYALEKAGGLDALLK
jgi:glutaredoxin 3